MREKGGRIERVQRIEGRGFGKKREVSCGVDGRKGGKIDEEGCGKSREGVLVHVDAEEQDRKREDS
jgi:hypothetical protein